MNQNLNQNFSIIIPTLREAKNIPLLMKRIAGVDYNNREFEVIIIDDDSQDGIVEIVQAEQKTYPWLSIVVRKANPDLSQSFVQGFHLAKHPILIGMDADLSHPPEKIPEMLDVLSQSSVDMVIGSRYIKGGSADEKWPIKRKITSRLAASLAKALLLTNIKDPLSGFFAITKSKCFSGGQLTPVGWKISLELMIKCHCRNVHEVPIHFSERYAGVSKLNMKVAGKYLQHVCALARYKLFP